MPALGGFEFDALHPDLHVWTGMKAAERDRALRALDAEIGRLTVAKAAMIRECERTRVYAEDCFRTVGQWVRAVGNTSRGTASYQVQLAKMFVDLPKVAEAFAAGAIGADQVRLFVEMWSNPRARAQLPRFEDFLLECACQFVLHEFRDVCDQWKLGADPDGAHKDHEESKASRRAQYDTIGAWFRLILEGDAVSGEMMKKVLDAHMEAEYLTDVEAREAEFGGEDAASHPLPRTNVQRMFDAVKVIFMKAASTLDTTAREPLVVLFSTPETLEEALREYFAAGSAGCATTGDLGDPSDSMRLRLCRAQSGAPVSLRDLAIAAIHGRVQRLVVDPQGHTINLGRKSRLFRGPSRDAILFNGGRCTGPGCHVRHNGIQVDHLKPWELFGRTDQDNGGPACGFCNRIKHTRRITVFRDESGWHWIRSDGTEIAPRGRYRDDRVEPDESID